MVEVRGETTCEAFTTMINYIYKPPSDIWRSSKFFTAPHMFLDEEDDEENFTEEEKTDNRIRCPQKFFELLDLAEKYEIISMVEELSSDDALKTLTRTMLFVLL